MEVEAQIPNTQSLRQSILYSLKSKFNISKHKITLENSNDSLNEAEASNVSVAAGVLELLDDDEVLQPKKVINQNGLHIENQETSAQKFVNSENKEDQENSKFNINSSSPNVIANDCQDHFTTDKMFKILENKFKTNDIFQQSTISVKKSLNLPKPSLETNYLYIQMNSLSFINFKNFTNLKI